MLDDRTLLDRMHLLSGAQFEQLCGQLFQALGYEVGHTPTSGDRGIDLELKKDGRLILVQCKRQQATVGEPAVRDFFGVVTHRGADKGVFVTNGSFSTRAETWAAGTRIELMDGAELVKLWREHAGDVELPEFVRAAASEHPTVVPRPEMTTPRVQQPLSPVRAPATGRTPLDGERRSKSIEYRLQQAERKWEAARCEALGVPRPTNYKPNGDVEKRLYVGPDGQGENVVVHDAAVLFRGSWKDAMEYYDRVKLDF